MDIRRINNKCDNCKHESDDLYVLVIGDKINILCSNCLDELKCLSSNYLFFAPKEEQIRGWSK